MDKDPVRDYYEWFGNNEWHRLTWPEGVLEFEVTKHVLGRHLPQHGRVLDIGGGPGRYTIWLAERGYRVVLGDLSPALVNIARRKIAEAGVESQVEEILVCDASDLSRFEDASFDAALCLGPFYHLTDPADREHAAAELVRVVRPQAKVFIALMPVYTFLRRVMAREDEQHLLAKPGFTARLMNEGVFINEMPGRFTGGYGVRPQDVAPFFEKHGLRSLDLIATTGLAASNAKQLAEMRGKDPAAYQSAMELIIRTANEPSLLGASIHILYIGQKPG